MDSPPNRLLGIDSPHCSGILDFGYAMRAMMIAVGTRNMVTNPLSWSSKSAVEPAAKIKGLNPGPHWNSNP